jgi:RHS repeat-associated protein
MSPLRKAILRNGGWRGSGCRKLGGLGPAFGTWERPSSPARSQFTQKLAASLPGLAKYLAEQRVSEWNGTTNAEIEGKYYWGGKPVAFYSGSVTHFEHQDWLGTERIRTTYNGGVEGTYTSLPFGDAQTTTSGVDWDAYHYAQLDSDSETNTDHAQFRQYSDAQGRWLSPDPYSRSYDAFNPQSFNRYVYAGNNPLSATDPSGLYRAAPCMGGSQCNNGYTGNPLDPSGSSQGLSGYFTIAVPTATWVWQQEIPGEPAIPAHWVYGWTYATFSLNNSSPSGPSPVGPGAPNTNAPNNGTPKSQGPFVCGGIDSAGCLMNAIVKHPPTKQDICHAAAIVGLVGLLTVPEVEIPAAAAWTLYGVGGASAIAGVTYCW